MVPSWLDSRFAKSACWRFSWRSRRGFKPKPCDSAPQCLWSVTRPRESPNGHSNLLPSNVHGSILQRNAPVDLFCAVRSVDLRETSVIALCRRSFFSVGWDNCSPSGTYFPESSSFRLRGSNRRDCACERWFDGKRFDHCLLSVWKSEIPGVGSVLERGKTQIRG